MQCAWQVENNAFCRRILARHWANVERFEDVRDFPPENKDGLEVDLICGGFPCQDLSVAGKRAGLAGEQSGLFFDLVRVVSAIRPPWLVLENVPGLLSSNEGRDFAIVLDELGKLGYCCAWRILDSQFFGVAQRRRRVFIVGHPDPRCAAAVLFDGPCGTGHPAAMRQQQGKHPCTAEDRVAGTLETSYGSKWQNNQSAVQGNLVVCKKNHTGRSRTTPGLPVGLDAARYRALGNAVTVPVAEWIGRRLMITKALEADALFRMEM